LVPDPGSSAGTVKFLREDATFAIPSAGAGTINSFSQKLLTSNVSITNGVQTTLTDFNTTITFPSSGGPWRVGVHYGVFWTNNNATAVNVWVSDATNTFCPSQVGVDSDVSDNRGSMSGGYSSVTYANSATITFSVVLECSPNNITVQQNAAVAGPGSYFQVAVFSSN